MSDEFLLGVFAASFFWCAVLLIRNEIDRIRLARLQEVLVELYKAVEAERQARK